MKQKIRTEEELIPIMATVIRINEYEFDVPSESNFARTWRVNLKHNTCRDDEGLGCIPMFQFRTCKHEQACRLYVKKTKEALNEAREVYDGSDAKS